MKKQKMYSAVFGCVMAAVMATAQQVESTTVSVGTAPDAGGGEYISVTKVTTNTVTVKKPDVVVVTNTVEVSAALPPHKARLAVLPTVFSSHLDFSVKHDETVQITGDIELKAIFTTVHESRWEAPGFSLSLQEAFVASRKFDVLERSRLSEVMKEIDFGASDYADSSKAVPMGRALNAEYVVLPEIEVIQLVVEAKEIPYIDQVQRRLKGKVIARVRVVDVATTKTVSAFTEETEVQLKVKESNPFKASSFHDLILALYSAESQRVMHRTVETVYPVRILELSAGKIVVNRGEGAVNIGDEFAIHELGTAYTDPDTGESLGHGEKQVARVRVTQIFPKFAEAEVVEGGDNLTGPADFYVCRETPESIQKKTSIHPLSL